MIAVPSFGRLGSWAQMLERISRWIDTAGIRFGPGERIELGYGPHAAYTLPPEALAQAGAAARQYGALLHLHVAEPLGEDTAVRQAHGSVPLLLEQLGVLGAGARVPAAHAVQLSTPTSRCWPGTAPGSRTAPAPTASSPPASPGCDRAR